MATNVLFLVSFLDLFAVSLIVPSLPAFIKSLGGDALTVGYATALYGAIQMLTAPLAGVLSDIYDRRLILLVGIAGATIGYVLLGMSLTLSMAMFSRVPCGIFKHSLSTIRLIVADQTLPNLRADAMGKINAYSSFGFIFGPLLGGYLSSVQNGFNFTALLTAIVFVVNYVLVYTCLPRYPPASQHNQATIQEKEDENENEDLEVQDSVTLLPSHKQTKHQPLLKSLSAKLGEYNWILKESPMARNILAVRLLMAAAAILFRSHFMLLLEEKYNASSVVRGYILSYMGVLAASSSFFVGLIVSIAPSEAILVQIASIVYVLTFLGIAMVDSLWLVLALQAPQIISISILRACSVSLQTAAVQPQHLGGILGLSTSLTALARTFAPMLSGYLYVVSVDGPAFGATILAVMSSVLFYMTLFNTNKMNEKDIQAAPVLFPITSKRGVHRTPQPFTTTEQRFKWQNSNANTDALYKLPGTLSPISKSFGTSTREDWDPRSKKAVAGIGTYEAPKSCGKQVSSMTRTSSSISFSVGTRLAAHSNNTPSPGPIYNLPGAFDNKITNAFGFGTSKRPPLDGAYLGPGPTTGTPGPGSLPKYASPCITSTFGSEKRLRQNSNVKTPGPIYDVECTGFRTGPKSSFSIARRL
ncbi:hypothetical protein THRCLA_08411 [Thraustotheca clavata]|uniref:Major facilitator superfamily (MFS) profile domain-containing protein n=1 Tax=Thraustotheca clavata TaxID=74557 RepID=A0A1V9Z6M8_9STRA|nr:hypothetical protein THRCLA_08411 [Thraustotheca clavata]